MYTPSVAMIGHPSQ